MDALCEKVDNIAKEFTTLKNVVQPQRSHEETMKYLEEVLEKSWETVRILEARQKEEDRLERLENERLERVEKYNKEEESTQVEEIRLIDDIPNDTLTSLENCTLDKIILYLQNHSCDPTVNSDQAGFGYFIANHVITEKLDMYHKESMVPPMLGDVWEPMIYVTIGKSHVLLYLIFGLVFQLFLNLYMIILIYRLLKSVILT
jgi:hypothetical protein